MLLVPTSQLRTEATKRWCMLNSVVSLPFFYRVYTVNTNTQKVKGKPHITLKTTPEN